MGDNHGRREVFMMFEVSTKFRKFENCRFIFSVYPDDSCLKCDLICHEHTLLGCMTIQGPELKNRLCIYVKEKAMTNDFMNMLFSLNVVSACKKVCIDGEVAYCCALKKGLNLFNNKQPISAFA